jgi:hypothetical protein
VKKIQGCEVFKNKKFKEVKNVRIILKLKRSLITLTLAQRPGGG